MRLAAAALVSSLALTLLGGCASAPRAGRADADAQAPARIDPWEGFNRKVFGFNEAVDKAVLKPVAQTYVDVVPGLVRTGIGNVLGNLHDVWSTANNFMQGKVQYGLEMGMRVLTNTVFGIGGLLDPATEMRLVKRSEDFGQTLGRWGLANGPFLVLPFLGPSTVRDTTGTVVGFVASPSRLPDTTAGSYAVTAIDVIDLRASLLATGKLLDEVSLDKYSFVRDAYLAQRRDALYDGAPPMDTFEDEPASAPPPAVAAPGAAASAPAAAASAAPR